MQRLPTRRIAGFALRFAVVYLALVAAWPVLAPAYRPVYCALGNVLFRGGEASVEFRTKDPGSDLDVELVLTNRGTGARARMANSSRLIGYLPTVTLIALVLATPVSWKRRRRALLLGLALVTLFVALRMALPIRREFSNPELAPLMVHHPGAVGRWALGVAQRAFLRAPASWFVVPILIWIGVAFRRRDWELLEEPEAGPAPPAE